MATRADFYRTRATECEQAANAATDQKARQTYSELANQWRELARQQDRHDPAGHGRSGPADRLDHND